MPSEEGREAWRRLHAFRLARHQEVDPQEAPTPDEIAEVAMKRPDVMSDRRHLVLEGEGEILSTADLEASKPGTPEYESNRHHVEAQITVLAGRRRQGLGSSWLPAVAAFARSRGARLVSFHAFEESGHSFAAKFGAEARLSERESRLWLDEVDWDLMRRWAAIEAPGLRFEHYSPFPPAAIWEDYGRGYTELERHVPRENLEVGEWILTSERLANDEIRHREQGLTRYVLVAYDSEGMAGLTELLVRAHDPHGIDQELTAVHPRARGRGLGKLLKARLLLHVRELRPEARYVRTWNANSNAAMLAINIAMGFKPHRHYVEYQVPVENLG